MLGVGEGCGDALIDGSRRHAALRQAGCPGLAGFASFHMTILMGIRVAMAEHGEWDRKEAVPRDVTAEI
nr:hypothetical protein [uncultured Rhodopila sp.]